MFSLLSHGPVLLDFDSVMYLLISVIILLIMTLFFLFLSNCEIKHWSLVITVISFKAANSACLQRDLTPCDQCLMSLHPVPSLALYKTVQRRKKIRSQLDSKLDLVYKKTDSDLAFEVYSGSAMHCFWVFSAMSVVRSLLYFYTVDQVPLEDIQCSHLTKLHGEKNCLISPSLHLGRTMYVVKYKSLRLVQALVKPSRYCRNPTGEK